MIGSHRESRTKSIVYVLCAWVCIGSSAAPAQETRKIPRIGLLSANSAQNENDRLAVFRERLRDLGYHEGKSIFIEYRFADGKLDRLPELASELERDR